VQTTSMITPLEKRDILRENIARLLMDGEHDQPFDPSPYAWSTYLADARLVQRLREQIAYDVALNEACRSYAQSRGWSWPDLVGFAPAEGDVMLGRAEMRQRIRRDVSVLVGAFLRHLRDGRAEHEAAVVKRIQAERASDELTRRTMKPKPPMRVLPGGVL
jgi:hypothetical protein